MSKKNPIKVLMFGWEFPPFNSGGLGVACLGLTKALAKQGVQITFVLPRKFDVHADFMQFLYATQLKNSNLFLEKLITYTTLTLYKQNSVKNTSPFASLLEEVKNYGELAREIAETEEFDIIHAHDWLTFPAAIAAKEVSGKPLITHIHATEFDRTGTVYGNREVYDIEKLGMEHADRVIPVSNYTKELIVNHYGISPSKISVIHNGVESPNTDTLEQEILDLKTHNKIVLFVGRLTLQKGPDYFIRAAQKVLMYEPNVVFVMVGSGDMKEKLIHDSVALGISDKVIFTGFLRDANLKQLYKSADLFVMPSVSEPFGIAGLESAINGTPILVSKQSGVSEVLTHALKVDFWDIDEMTNKIVAVLTHESLKATLKSNSTQESETITWEEAAKKMKAVYGSVT